MGAIDRLLLGRYGPYLVLVAAILLPGVGHVLVGQTRRGLLAQMFMILLALVTWHLTTPAQSLLGRLAGGLFVYAMSVPEAYRLARLRAASAGVSHVGPVVCKSEPTVALANKAARLS